ncbi:MAG: ferritin-like domain-containing protein [Caldilineaceae bacterium]|nr:ferritin-like domain-containing protein [Caldilineaceae bacterium]
MQFNSLQDVYVHELKDLYSAEKQIVDALPKMAEAAASDDLRTAFLDHLKQSREHMTKVNDILSSMSVNPGSVKCKGMEGLLKEGEDVIGTDGQSKAKDAALIAAAQRVEHYEMAAYGAARTHAEELGHSDAASTLQTILDQEGKTNEKLTSIAEGGFMSKGVNQQASR